MSAEQMTDLTAVPFFFQIAGTVSQALKKQRSVFAGRSIAYKVHLTLCESLITFDK